MPLVIPGVTSNKGENDKTNKWMNELVGKKIGDSSNETVRPRPPDPNRIMSQCTIVSADLFGI